MLAWTCARPQSTKVAGKCTVRCPVLLGWTVMSSSCHPTLEGRVSMPILPKGATMLPRTDKDNTLILQELASFSCSAFRKARGTSATVTSVKRRVGGQCCAADLCRGWRGGAAASSAQPGLHHQAAGDTGWVHRCATSILRLPCGASHYIFYFIVPR